MCYKSRSTLAELCRYLKREIGRDPVVETLGGGLYLVYCARDDERPDYIVNKTLRSVHRLDPHAPSLDY